MQNIEIRKEPAQPTLVDIRDVAVDKKLPREERVAEFVRQIKKSLSFQMRKIYCARELRGKRRHD